ncbi:MAG TPA: DUF3822 family protein [Bacteroidales bacterium]|nr:DUF3822 family protein [Bacteroidales bacterium]
MPFLELFDETLDINSTENYELSVQGSPDGLAFSILDTIRNKFIMIRAFEPEENKYFSTANINELISRDDFLSKRYKKINIIIPSQKFTLVPSALYDPGKKEEYFSLNHSNDDNDPVNSNKIEDPDSYLVFSSREPVHRLFSESWPGIFPVHHLKPLLHHISHARKNTHGNYIHLHVERDYFNLVIADSNSLFFCNTFRYRNISDIMYYVLNVLKKLGIGQEETIFFSGNTEKYDDLSSGIAMYIRSVKFAEPSGKFTFSYVFNDLELQRYLCLFSIVNCE